MTLNLCELEDMVILNKWVAAYAASEAGLLAELTLQWAWNVSVHHHAA
jgi:hypothetical protein